MTRFIDQSRVRRSRQAGFTLLEVQVAFVLLGFGLVGVLPLVVLQLKLSKKLRDGVNPQSSYFGAAQTSNFNPSTDPWMRKLGVGATISASAPSPPSGSSPPAPNNVVTIVAPIVKSSGSETITVHVSVTPVASSGSGSGP